MTGSLLRPTHLQREEGKRRMRRTEEDGGEEEVGKEKGERRRDRREHVRRSRGRVGVCVLQRIE